VSGATARAAAARAAWLKHPATLLVAVAVGVFIGLHDAEVSRLTGIPDFAAFLAVPGELYLFYLQMTVLPIIVTAIASSLGKLTRRKAGSPPLRRIVAVFTLCVVVVGIGGMAAGIAGQPGAGLDEGTRSLLSDLINGPDRNEILEVSLSGGIDTGDDPDHLSVAAFFRGLIPANIFQALSAGSTLAVVFFAIIFGIAVGFLRDRQAAVLIEFLEAVFEAFQKLINWSLYLLPFGLVCLLAGQVATLGPRIFMAMSKFIVIYGIGCAAIFVVVTIVIWARSGISNPFRVVSGLFEPVMLAFATRNSMATLPSAISCLDSRLGFERAAVNLTLPLGMTVGRFGNIFYFGLASFFVIQIYGMTLTPEQYPLVLLGVIFAGTATAGASGIVTLSVINIVLNPLRLPVEAALVIFMAIDPIIDPLRTFLIVYVNMAAAALIAGREGTAVRPLAPGRSTPRLRRAA